MGDSDDEYDRRSRGRDKFRRERNDYTDRNAGNRRDDWNESRDQSSWTNQNRDRGAPQRRDFRDNYNAGNSGQRVRERYSPADRSDMSPPMKRQRSGRDWDDRGYPNYEMGSGAGHNWNAVDAHPAPLAAPHQRNDQHRENAPNDNSPLTQPPLMPFKAYLATMDDTIDDQEAVKKYNEYKLDFKKKQILDFFKAHKDEEWFRSKYHPEEYSKRKAEQTGSLKNRLRVFMDLLNTGWIDSVSIDVEKAPNIIRVLDAAVIKLEGGTDFDLKALDENYDDDKTKEPDLSLFSVDVEKPKNEKDEQWTGKAQEQEGSDDRDDRDDGECKDSNDDNEIKENIEVKEETEFGEKNAPESSDEHSKPPTETMEEGEASTDANEPNEQNDEKPDDEEREMIREERSHVKEEKEKSEKDYVDSKQNEERPLSLHKTASIFLRNLAPSITKEEVEELCKQHRGFLRLCIADPQPERRFYRRGWATYERDVNIKDICWEMNSIKLRECELGAIVNRDLSRRIRSVNGIASHRNVVQADIRHAAKIVFNLDQQRKMWDDESNEKGGHGSGDEKRPMFGFASRNPLLKNITDYLIEEASAEEEELLGTSDIGEDGDGDNGPSLDRDESLIKVLDRLMIYLRIVHSVDYYNHSDYPNEDEMPNRIGIMHARGMVSTSSRVTQQEINDYIAHFETKIQSFLQTPPVVTEEEAVKLGWKDPEEEGENFVKENIKEVGKEKWLCPISQKKFKGPEYVRKHILNKYYDRVEDAKKNAEYLNNYIYDPKRPQLPEHPSNRQSTNTPNRNETHPMGMGVGPMPPYGMPPGHGPFPPPPWGYGPRGPMAGFGGPMMGYGPGRYPHMGPPHDYGRGPMTHGKPRYSRPDPREIVAYDDVV